MITEMLETIQANMAQDPMLVIAAVAIGAVFALALFLAEKV